MSGCGYLVCWAVTDSADVEWPAIVIPPLAIVRDEDPTTTGEGAEEVLGVFRRFYRAAVDSDDHISLAQPGDPAGTGGQRVPNFMGCLLRLEAILEY